MTNLTETPYSRSALYNILRRYLHRSLLIQLPPRLLSHLLSRFYVLHLSNYHSNPLALTCSRR